jgi:hypothetical protein
MGGRRSKGIELKEGIYIIGEGITEQYYFSHLKKLKKYECFIKPRFFEKTSIDDIEKSVKSLLSGGITVICVFDADVSERDMKEKEKLNRFLKKYKNNKDLIICDSLPSIEFWFLLHFVKTNKAFLNSKVVEKELKKHFKDYRKTKEFLENAKWVENLTEKLEFACKHAKSIGQHNGYSYSNIYMAIDVLEKKAFS